MPWDAGEAEPIEASHLLRVRCVRCGSEALAAPGRTHAARCADCSGSSVVVPARSMTYTVSVGYPLSRATSSAYTIAEVTAAYPAPRIVSHERAAADAPGGVGKLAQRAVKLDWGVRVQSACGCFSHRRLGTPGPVRSSFAVRMRRDGWGAYAVHVGATWESVMLWGRELPWFPHANVTELGRFLIDPEDWPSLLASVRERLAK